MHSIAGKNTTEIRSSYILMKLVNCKDKETYQKSVSRLRLLKEEAEFLLFRHCFSNIRKWHNLKKKNSTEIWKESFVTQNFFDHQQSPVHKDSNEMILMIKAPKNQNICDLEKCAWNNNQNKDVISEEFMVYE